MTEIAQSFIEHLIQASPLALLGGRRVLYTPLHSRSVPMDGGLPERSSLNTLHRESE